MAAILLASGLAGCGQVSEGSVPDLAESAHLVVDLNTQPYDPTFERNSSFPSFVTAGKGAAFFVAFPNWGGDGTLSSGLYRSDGTKAGTTEVHSFGKNYPTELASLNDRIVFLRDDDTGAPGLWSSDGTEAGTAILQPFAAGTFANFGVVHDGGYYTFVDDSVSSATGSLWRTDGTESGTSSVFTGGASTLGFASTKQGLYFAVRDVAGSSRILRTDGTRAGTTDLGTMPVDADGWMCGLGDKGLVITHTKTAFQLWTADSSAITQTAEIASSVQFASCTSLGDRATLLVGDADGNSVLWGTNGTQEGTVPLSGNDFGGQGFIRGTSFFVAGGALYETDGTPEGTVKVVDGSFKMLQESIGDRLLIWTEPTTTSDLWISDGTAKGTHLLWKKPAMAPGHFTEAGANVVFVGDEKETGYELWAAPRDAFQ